MKKNIIFTVVAIALVAVLAIGATAAYMTDGEEVTNTFTVGDLDITLYEPEWDDTTDGKDMEPGYVTEKDPTVKAIDGKSYMRLTVEFVSTDADEMTADRAAKIMDTINYNGAVGVNSAFTLDNTRSTATKYVYNYNGEFVEGDEAVLFDTVKIPTEWNQNDLAALGTYKLVIRAEAIQSYSFDTAEDAYAALDAEIDAATAQENYKTVNGGV